MKIGIIKLSSMIHDEKNYLNNDDVFLNEIFKNSSIEYALINIDDYNMFDYVFWLIETGGTESIFKSYYQKTKGPYYLLTTGMNNSLAASMEILSFLKKNDEEGEILHGTYESITNKIQNIICINEAINKLRKTRLGVIGTPSDWLIASSVDYIDVEDFLGIKLIDISMNELEKEINKGFIPPNEIVNDVMKKDFNLNEIKKALEIYGALKNIILKNKLNGITIRCFDLLSNVRGTGCLALSLLNNENITSTCEGDLQTLITMEIAKNLTGYESFQANPAMIDSQKNEITFAHCTIPLNMTSSYELKTHFESGIGVAIKGELPLDDVTVFKVSDDFETYFVSKGKVIANLNEDFLCRTQVKIHLDKSVNYFLTNPIGNHHVIIKGNYEELINDFFKVLLNK